MMVGVGVGFGVGLGEARRPRGPGDGLTDGLAVGFAAGRARVCCACPLTGHNAKQAANAKKDGKSFILSGCGRLLRTGDLLQVVDGHVNVSEQFASAFHGIKFHPVASQFKILRLDSDGILARDDMRFEVENGFWQDDVKILFAIRLLKIERGLLHFHDLVADMRHFNG